jgi:outer membrane protein assembly factor BamC
MRFHLPLILIFVTGCAFIGEDTSKDFFQEELSKEIFSNDGSSVSQDDHYPILINGNFQKEPIDIPKPRQIFSSGQTREVQLRRLGELLWVYVEALPSTSWPITKAFFETSGFPLINSNPESGELKLRYSENIDLKVEVEHGIKEASTEIFVSFYAGGSKLTQDEWVEASQDTLAKLVEYMAESVDSFSGTSLAAQALNDKKKTRIFNLDEKTIIELDLGFDRAWSAVSRALDDGKIQVNDRDREEGFFLVSFKAQDEDDGWFSFLNFQDEPNSGLALGSDADFKIIVSTEDSSTKITAEVINSSAGDPESLLSKINELLS